jgi:hypothetical protein
MTLIKLASAKRDSVFQPAGSRCPKAGLSASLPIILICLFSCARIAAAMDGKSYVSDEKRKGAFTLSASGLSAPLVASSADYPGVVRVLKHLQDDIARVTGLRPVLSLDAVPADKELMLAGTLGKCPVVDAGVVLHKLVIETGEVGPTYLGPPESLCRAIKSGKIE